MNTTAKRRFRLGWAATLLAAALPLGAAHAVETVAAAAIPATAGGAPAPDVSDPSTADCPPPDAGQAVANDNGAQTGAGESAGGGAVGMEQAPRWKTLLPGALR